MNIVSICNVWNVVYMVHQGNIQHVPMILDMPITDSICYQLMAKHINYTAHEYCTANLV